MARAEPRPPAGVPSDADDTLQLIVEGLIARLEAAPPMRKPPTQCTPEEQAALITLLSGLAQLRAAHAALAAVPAISTTLAAELWPELGGMFSAAARGASRGPAGAPPAPEQPARETAREVPAVEPEEPEPAEEDVAFEVPAAPPVAAAAGKRRATAAPVAAPPMVAPAAGAAERDLGAAVRELLRSERRPWSATRIAERLQEADPLATREEVYNTLWQHPDQFRRTGQGWQLIAR